MADRVFLDTPSQRRRRRLATGAAVVSVLLAGGAVGTGLVAAHQGDPERQPLPLGECPDATKLPRTAIAWASFAALRQAHHVYPKIDREGAYVQRAYLAADATDRGGAAKKQCGRRIQDRTVVVDLRFPAMEPSASLSQGTVYVSRIDRGDEADYRIWDRRK